MIGESMTWLQAIVLGAVQGLTEFLPISSSGHLRIVSGIFWGDDAGASFTAVSQLGTEAAVLVFFWRDIVRIISAWCRGLINSSERGNLDYRMGWYVIIATIPIGILGYAFKDAIRTGARNLWLISAMLIFFALVIAASEKVGSKSRPTDQITTRDGLVMGAAQCLALIPGVSRSGATTSAGLFMGLERQSAVRFSFLLAIPAVTASGLFSLPDAFAPSGAGLNASGPQLAVATFIAFALGYASIAWLLRFVTNHSLYWFVGYRIVLGIVVMGLLAGGVVSAT